MRVTVCNLCGFSQDHALSALFTGKQQAVSDLHREVGPVGALHDLAIGVAKEVAARLASPVELLCHLFGMIHEFEEGDLHASRHISESKSEPPSTR